MNQNSSYIVPNHPQIKPEQMNTKNLNDTPTKHILYYSNYCKHSQELLKLLQKESLIDNLELINIDYRYMKGNVTYLKLPNNQSFPLPPMINCVPTLCLMPNYEILSGSKIVNFFKPIHENIDQERNSINMEPNPYCLDKETIGSYGVSSDSFSFYDSNEDELSASGNGGARQMYNYASFQGNNQDENSIVTPMDEGREKKINISLEQLQQRRNMEI